MSIVNRIKPLIVAALNVARGADRRAGIAARVRVITGGGGVSLTVNTKLAVESQPTALTNPGTL